MTDTTRRRKLLVATPAIGDERFARTVILLIEHGEIGAMGIVLNRPTEIPLAEVLPQWAERSIEPPVLFRGGPVDSSVAVALASASRPDEPYGFTPLFDGLGVVDLSSDAPRTNADIDRIRVFSGYAGWSADQLDGELEVGAWFQLDAHAEDPFIDDPDLLWERVLRRQGGKYLMYANYPSDPSLN